MSENASDATDQSTQGPDQWAAFQKIWAETFNRMLQLGVTFSPESTPPEFIRQMRTSIFQAMAQSWDEFLRSPQFLDGMKQWMEGAIAFRKLTNDTLTRMHQEMQSPARADVDAVLLALRHMEQRLNDRIEQVEARLPQPAPAKPARNGTASRKRARAPKNVGGKTA